MPHHTMLHLTATCPVPEEVHMLPETTAHRIAAELILAHAENIEFMTVGEHMIDTHGHLPDDAFDTMQRRIHDLTREAVVTVTWPDPPQA